jgi:hypothetical protein
MNYVHIRPNDARIRINRKPIDRRLQKYSSEISPIQLYATGAMKCNRTKGSTQHA